MKASILRYLFVVFFLLFVFIALSAQDSIRKIQVVTRYTNKLSITKKISTKETITKEIRFRLDSLANIANGRKLRLSIVRAEIELILHPYWRRGMLRGDQRAHAYFIQTGFQTMTQADSLNVRILITVGLAIQKPAEFELLQFEQMVRTKKLVLD